MAHRTPDEVRRAQRHAAIRGAAQLIIIGVGLGLVIAAILIWVMS